METQVEKLQRELRELRDAIEVARQAQSAATNDHQRAVNKMDDFLQTFYIKEIIRTLDAEKAATKVSALAERFAVADVLSFGCEKVTFDQLVDGLGSDELVDDAVVCEEYEHYDKDSLIRKLNEIKSGYIAFADALDLEGGSK